MSKTEKSSKIKHSACPAAKTNPAADRISRVQVSIKSHIWVIAIFTGMLLFSACSFNLDTMRSLFIQASSTPDQKPAITPSPFLQEEEALVTVSPQSADEITNQHILTLWIPPQFDPENGTQAGTLFKNRLDSFMKDYPNVQIDVRIKSVSGPGGLLESLTTTSAAAPDALPTLILLNRSALETASLKGMISPLDELSDAIDDPDWYDYARELAIIQGTVYGLPFTGDAALLVYRPVNFPAIPNDWETIQALQQPIIFPAADPEGLLTLTLYKSLGGAIQDTQLRPTLDAEKLSVVFKLYEDNARNAIFSSGITQYQTDSQAWQAYKDQNANAIITWCSRYLTELPADSTALPLPTLGDKGYTVADGWMWALAGTDPERKILGTTLVEYLVDGAFLAEWSPQIGYLPVKPSSLNAQTNQNLRSLLNQIVVTSHVRPANDLTTTIGPIVQEAAVQLIKRQTNAVDASLAAVEKLTPAEQ
jgi:ABC-type glycerol-3-phosphate transport system substrate-binding protein